MEWISVKDKLPDDNRNVLIHANKLGDRIDVAFYNDEDKEWQGLNEYWTRHVTHWMPLPNPPIVLNK